MPKDAAPERHYARWPIQYGVLHLDRGQVFTLAGARNDEKLERLGYISRVDSRIGTVACAECGAEFIGDRERAGHGDARHTDHGDLTPDQEDDRLEREQRRLQAEAPLYLENSAASRQ